METYANGIADDEMISSLSFKIDPNANYVTDRKSVTYQAQGSQDYKAGGGTVVKFTITGTGQYLGPLYGTIRFYAQKYWSTTTIPHIWTMELF